MYNLNRDSVAVTMTAESMVQYCLKRIRYPPPPTLACTPGVSLSTKRCDAIRQLEQNEERLLSGLMGNHGAADLSHLRNRPKIEPQIFAVSCQHLQASQAIEHCLA